MNGITKRLCAVTAFSLGATAAAAIASPALAQSALHVVQSLVTCGTSRACVSGNNTGSGAGVAGSSANGNGVTGYTKATLSENAAVYGNSNGTATGVYGESSLGYGMRAKNRGSSGIGLGAVGGGFGVYGSSNRGGGVFGASSSGTGVSAVSIAGYGLDAQSSTNAAIHAYNSTSGPAVAALATAGNALYANTSHGSGAMITTNDGYGADIYGTIVGIAGSALAGTSTYPLLLTDSSGHNLFYVDGDGNVFYHGTISGFLRTTRGNIRAYGASSTTPSVEDVGSAELRNGSARVRLDPVFARSIDGSTYHVFLTPGGDTRGLFVAERDGDGFVVKESQGGRSSITFDYRIVATQSGHTTDRMAFASPNAMPKAPLPKLQAGVRKLLKPVVPAVPNP